MCVAWQGYNEILMSCYSGRIVSFTTEPLHDKASDDAHGRSLGTIQNENKIKLLKKEIQDLAVKVRRPGSQRATTREGTPSGCRLKEAISVQARPDPGLRLTCMHAVWWCGVRSWLSCMMQVEQERDRYVKATHETVPLSQPFQVISTFSLDADEAAYKIIFEIPTPIGRSVRRPPLLLLLPPLMMSKGGKESLFFPEATPESS